MTWTRTLSPGSLTRRDIGLVAVVTVVQVLGVRTGPPAPSPTPVLGTVGLLLALTQGLSLLWRRPHPTAVLVVSTSAFVAYAVLLAPVPPYSGWVALASLAARRELRAAALAAAGVVAACAVAYLPACSPARTVSGSRRCTSWR